MSALGQGINGLFDLLLGPVAGVPQLAMVLVSVLAAVLALLIFKHTTDQHKLDRTRDRLLGHIYEMGLYQDHLSVLARIQGRLALANLRYLGVTLPAVLALLIPMVIVVVQLESRFAHRPLAAGESTLLTVQLDSRHAADLANLDLVVPPGVAVTSGPVRSVPAGTAVWRLRLDDPAASEVKVLLDGREVARRQLRPAGKLPRLSPTSRPGWLEPILAPGVAPLPADGVLSRVTLHLPERHTRYLGLTMNWLVAFCVFSLLGGLLLKGPLRVSI